MRKLLSILVILCMAFSLLPATVLAADVISSGVGADGLRWSYQSDGVLTVTGSGPMRSYQASDITMDRNIDQRVPTPWVRYASEIQSVVIGEGVTEVGDYTFIDCRALKRVQLPSTLRRVGAYAFSDASLESLQLPNGLQRIGSYAFAENNFQSVILPASVTELGDHAFYACKQLNVVWILGPVGAVDIGTFGSCYGLTDVFLSSGIGSIHRNGFTGTQIVDVYYGGSRDSFYAMTGNVYGDLTDNTNRFHFNFLLNPYVSFTDVAAGAWYAESVLWAAQRGITTGTGPGRFSPGTVCTRAQMVTLLWRAMGSAEPFFPNENPFTDVNPADYYYKAVLWAKERGIAKGTSASTFSPNNTVTRAETVTFLSRAANDFATIPTISFTDVSRDAYYYEAVRWAENDGITTGVAPGVFGPDLPCTRAEIVTFLNRAKMVLTAK